MASRWVKVKTFKSLSTSKLEKKLQIFKSYNSLDIIEIKRYSYLFLNIVEVYYKEKI
ncbi:MULTISPECIES: hypothetical protein [Staphylococcus]|uniref:hypothetical protein n=1 Tax=Staphylococcus TaxID=1279 RepID=UPI001886D76E|nr:MULTISPECIES: hypothetical protein [Staphylococcus]MBF2261865.1 hypothetical protein [Staphylococcus capitis]MBF2282673.1 hypothetical protein [Staphylococcus capitis]MCI2899040.1 hypothetical protein [Staphylococcus hominis]MDS3904239.1 hypothetical protein [Staphylococcus hominis]